MGHVAIFDFLKKLRPNFELTSIIKGMNYQLRPHCILPMDTMRLANDPNNGEEVFLFACFPCFMIKATFVLSHHIIFIPVGTGIKIVCSS